MGKHTQHMITQTQSITTEKGLRGQERRAMPRPTQLDESCKRHLLPRQL